MTRCIYTLANLLFVFYSIAGINDKNISFQNVEAKAGDGVFSLLRRYQLAAEYCNIEQFYKINKLSKADFLKAGREYTLPVYVFPYNGKSIRSTIGENDWQKAIRIKEYNEWLKNNELRSDNYTSDKKLWVPHHELHCAAVNSPENISISSTPSSSSKPESFKKHETKYPLFGKKYENVKVVDESLKGQVFYLVSGHGGPDPGTNYSGYSKKICEDEYAYDVALRVARDLMQHGASVEVIVRDRNDGIRDERLLTCDYDEYYEGDIKIVRHQLTRLADRTKVINDLYRKYKKKGFKNQKAVMIHVDSQNKSKRQDVYFYYAKNSKSSKALATSLQSTFKSKYEKYQKNRGYKGFVKDRGLFMLRNTLPTAVYIELANIKNSEDHKRLLMKENRQALANWIFEGIIDKP